MEFLDKGTEYILKQCIDNESTFPAILCDMLKQCDDSLEVVHLRGRINTLVKEGYIELHWASNLPYFGNITPKGLGYFKKKDIYVRAMLRKHPDFSLSAESEECLKRLLDIQSDDSYILISESIGAASTVQDLASHCFIQLGAKGISYEYEGGFTATIMILPKGRSYFQDKNDYIEEILTFPQDFTTTQINISSGDNSQIQVGTTNSTQSAGYDFDIAQKALNEIITKLDELGLKLDEQQELLDNVEEAQKLVKEQKKGPLKAILKGIWELISGVGSAIASSLIIAQLNL